MRSITRAQARELKKIHRNLRRKKGLVFKTEASCRRLSHFPISSVLKKKLMFGNIQGVYKVFGGFFVKEKRLEKQRQEATA